MSRGFKLVMKVIIALIIIFVVLGLLNPFGGSRIQTAGRIAWAKDEVTALVTAIKACQTEYGAMPSGDSVAILKTLQGDNPRKIQFFAASQGPKYFDAAGHFLDPWKTPFRIDISDPANPKVWSAGKNKKDAPDDPNSEDICSWR